MRNPTPVVIFAAAVVLLAPFDLAADGDRLAAAVAGDHRSAAHKARDKYRHPVETLKFFGIQPDMTVVEMSPGGGWYTEILAPYLRGNGLLYAANYDPESSAAYYQKAGRAFLAKLSAEPAVYDQVVATVFAPPAKVAVAPPGSADMVVTFRNLHNWLEAGTQDAALSAMHVALKPGGVLGIVAHRQAADVAQDPEAASGYIREDYVIEMVEAAGFELAASSEINANPRDVRDYPEGVWSLPPTYEQGDVNRDRYRAIGESDRMTLKFVKK